MNENLSPLSALELMLRWNHYCDTHDREGDCILLNEERTYWEAFDNEQQAMEEIINSRGPEFRRNNGFLIPVWENDGRYKGMKYVPEDDIWGYFVFEILSIRTYKGFFCFLLTLENNQSILL